MNTCWTEKEAKFLRQNYRRLSTEEIAEALGRTKRAVYLNAHRLGVAKHSLPNIKICEMYLRGESTMSLAKMFSTDHSVISRILKRHNIKIRSLSEAAKLAHLKGRMAPNIERAWLIAKERGIHGTRKIPENIEEIPEFYYILGVVLGDGWISHYKTQYRIGLSVKDLDFALTFKKSFSKLGIKTRLRHYRNLWTVEVGRKRLFTLLKRLTLQAIEKLVLDSRVFKIKFIRGLFDSEGTVYTSKRGGFNVKIYNTNRELLELLRRLLLSLRIVISGIYLHRKGRSNSFGQKDVYSLCICRKEEALRFAREISSNISRKKAVMSGWK